MKNIDDLINDIDFDSNKLVCTDNGLYLTNYQISILSKYHINYLTYSDYNELMLEIDDVLNEEYEEDLEDILKQIMEFNYYHNVNK